MPWNPDTYNKFKAERFAPFDDLLKLITVKPELKIIDLGCGTGELTQKLAAYLPGAKLVLGIDSSAEMLQQSEKFATENCVFKQQDIEAVLDEKEQWDLIFSNAALQWVADHKKLFPRIISMIKSSGQLAIQVPSNNDHYTHIAIKEIAGTEPYKSALQGWTRDTPVLSIEEYAQILFDNGAHAITVYEKAYPHILKDADALAEWTSGTALVPYLEKLPKDLHDSFIMEYKQRLYSRFPGNPVFYPFKRIIMGASF